MESLAEQVAIVTGGGTGIGRAITLALARAGAWVLVCGRRPEPLHSVVAEIDELGGTAQALTADLAAEAEAERVVGAALEAYGRLDILVNNAGVGGGSEIHQQAAGEWSSVMAVNLDAPFRMARAALAPMREQRRGHILNLSSEAGLEYYAGQGVYGVSKHALNALGEYIQRENQHLGIKVNTICPGMVLTEMTANTPGLDHAKCLTPEDIAELALWLVTRRPNVKIGLPILIQTMENPWT